MLVYSSLLRRNLVLHSYACHPHKVILRLFKECFRIGNPDLDFDIRISDFEIKHETENGFCFTEIFLRGGFH